MSTTTTATTPSLEGLRSPDDALSTLTLAQIDHELGQLEALLTQRTPSTTEVATALAHRIEALRSERPAARARARVQERQRQEARATAARQTFEDLEVELGRELRAQAEAIDQWVADGVRHLAAYAATLQRLGDVQKVLSPPRPGYEMALLRLADHFELDEVLEQRLAQMGILRHVTVRGTPDPVSTHVATWWRKFLGAARERLPVAPGPDARDQEGGR